MSEAMGRLADERDAYRKRVVELEEAIRRFLAASTAPTLILRDALAAPIPALAPAVTLPDPAFAPLDTLEARFALVAGDVVGVQTDADGLRAYRVSAAPRVLPSGVWVIGLEGIAGCYLLDRVKAKRIGVADVLRAIAESKTRGRGEVPPGEAPGAEVV